ncbi:hypothetical protein SEA_LINETTI_77 [Gordonia phage Linetti]|nr:hypothetical protein SEA_LINETTI_77 [Gordonia phage Linetti]
MNIFRKIAITSAFALALGAPAAAIASPTPAPANVTLACTISTPTGPAPCPPPIVSTNGDSIGGGANTDPINMGDLPRTGPDYSYERPDYFDKPVEPTEPEVPAED